MKKIVILSVALTGATLAQSAQEKAELDFKLAQQQLRELKAKTLEEESTLVVAVEKLDDVVISMNRDLAKLLKDEDRLAGKQRQLDNELARRKGEFEYTLSSLRGYSRSFSNRFHSAEKQIYQDELGKIELAAEQAGDDLAVEISERISLLEMAADRLQNLSGGVLMEGSAVDQKNVIQEGSFALAGPIGYFAKKDGSMAGFTSFTADSVDFPSIIEVAPKDGASEIVALARTGSAVVPVDASMGKALQVARTQKTLGDYLTGGGVVGYGIVILGLFSLVIALGKFIEISRFPIPTRKKINAILDDLLGGRVPEAGEKAKTLPGMGGELVESGVTYFFDKRRILEDALMEKLGSIQPKLERFLPFLALAAAAAPMMGLLGTVLGIMKTFAMMSALGTGDSSAFSAGISEALITTAMGLIVAIPVIVVHGMLKSLAKARFGQAEGVALSLLNGTTEIGQKVESPEEEDLDEHDLVTA